MLQPTVEDMNILIYGQAKHKPAKEGRRNYKIRWNPTFMLCNRNQEIQRKYRIWGRNRGISVTVFMQVRPTKTPCPAFSFWFKSIFFCNGQLSFQIRLPIQSFLCIGAVMCHDADDSEGLCKRIPSELGSSQWNLC